MKAIWAFEPGSQNSTAIRGMHRLLLQIVQSPKNLELGFVITGNETDLFTAFNIPAEERFTSYPRKLILQELKQAQIVVPDRNLHLVDYDTVNITHAVDRFLKLAKSRDADLIALYTRRKHGLQRLIMGSFAETAVHRSNLNLLVVNPQTSFPRKFRQVLFASDFSQTSKRRFKGVLALCRRLKASLTVFHASEIIYRWSLDEQSPKILAYRSKVRKTVTWFESAAKAAKVPCQVEVDAEFKPITDLILNSARRNKADLIVVCAEAGRFAALIGGSVTRNLLRYGRFPVLVLKH